MWRIGGYRDTRQNECVSKTIVEQVGANCNLPPDLRSNFSLLMGNSLLFIVQFSFPLLYLITFAKIKNVS